MSPALSALVVITLFAPAVEAATLKARLLLADGRPAAGYVVSLVGSSLSAPCAADGAFALGPLPPPPFLLVASGPHGEMSAPIEVAEFSQALVELRIPETVRDSVTVVSGIAPGLDLLPASAATVISSEALEQRPPQRVVDVLQSVAGASKLGEGADSVPALRGLARGRTLILLDGARVSAERRAGPSATFIDPATLSSVEVLRGPGSVVYGSDAFGGVVNIVTRDPDPGPFALRFTLEGGAGAEESLGGSLAASFGVGSGSLLLEAHQGDTGDAEAGGGTKIFNSSFAARGGALRYLRPWGPGRLRASVQIDRVEDLGKAAIDSRAIRAFYPREDSNRFVLSWIGTPTPIWDALETTLFYGSYRVQLDRDRAATAATDRRIDRADTDANDASLRSVAGRAFAGGRLQLGLDLQTRFGLEAIVGRVNYGPDATTVISETQSAAIEDASQIASGLFATWTRPLAERWSVGAGMRADRVATRNRGGFYGDRSGSDAALSGNLSATWNPAPGWSATGQVARGFRAPSLSDRYFRGPSGRGFVTGNPALEPETSLQFDLALRRNLGRGAIAFYAYRYDFDELIERYSAAGDFFFRNRGESTVEGVELEAQLRLDERWSLDGGAAWSRARGGDGAAIDDAPAPNLFVGARLAQEWGYLFGRLAAHGRKDDPGPTELERAGFLLAELGGGWRMTEALELRATLRNAFDHRYTGSPDNAADLSPGRSLTVALTGRF